MQTRKRTNSSMYTTLNTTCLREIGNDMDVSICVKVLFVSVEESTPQAVEAAVERKEVMLESLILAKLVADLELSAEVIPGFGQQVRLQGLALSYCAIVRCTIARVMFWTYVVTCMFDRRLV